MHVNLGSRWAIPIAMMASVAVATPTLADFGPTRVVRTTSPGHDLDVTDYASDGGTVALTWDEDKPSGRRVYLGWSTDRGATWQRRRIDTSETQESQAAACAGWVWAINRLHVPDSPPGDWIVELSGRSTSSPIFDGSVLTLDGVARKPDLACAGNRRLVAAWLQQSGPGYKVLVHSRGVIPQPKGDEVAVLEDDLGTGRLSRGLAVAATKDMVYIAWYRGDELRLRRYAVGAGPDYLLTSLGTETLAVRQYGGALELGAHGTRVVLAYYDRADLKVRISTDSGDTFGSSHTLRDEPFPSEVGTTPTSVSIKGQRIVVGALEIAGGIDTLTARGFGYLSTDGGSSWTRKPYHDDGRLVAGLVKVGDRYRYGEAWDQTYSDPAVERLRFRRE